MKISFFYTIIFILIIVACSKIKTQADQEQDRQTIKQTWKDYIKLWEQGNASACAAYFTDDVINMPSLNSTQHGPAEIKEMFSNMFSTTKVIVIGQTSNEIYIHGDMAYEFGTLEQVFQQQDAGSDTVKYRYVSVLKRQPDGSWKWFRWLAQSG